MFYTWLKQLRSTFPSYTSRNHYLFRRSIGVMENAIILNIIFIFKSIDMSVLRVQRNIQDKILFILPYTFSTGLFLNLLAKALALFVCLSYVPERIMVVFKRFNCLNSLLFIIHLIQVWLLYLSFFQLLLVTCACQDYLILFLWTD